MAGIGFALRRLSRQDDILGVVQSFGYSAIVAAGPWIFTILSLSGINLTAGYFVSDQEISIFRVMVIYNFAFSLVFTGPLLSIVTRYLADRIYLRDVSNAIGAMMGSLLIGMIISAVIVVPFYRFVAVIPEGIQVFAIINYMLVAAIWMANVFVSALKDYTAVTKAFGMGMLAACCGAVVGSQSYGLIGMLMGFNIGLTILLFTLIARIFSEYPYRLAQPFLFLVYLRRYWDLALIGLIANVALWVDKWIMWFAPQREQVIGLNFYSNYDSAMFLAYLTTIPSLAMFLVSVETEFFRNYQRFYSEIQEHCSLAKIRSNHAKMVENFTSNLRNILILQGAISIVVIIASAKIFELLQITYLQIGMFRIAVLGAFFHMIVQFLSIFLAYFDLRKQLLSVHIFFLIANAGLTYVSMSMGFAFYGYGFFLAAVLTAVFAFAIVAYNVPRLPYLAFIKNNPSTDV